MFMRLETHHVRCTPQWLHILLLRIGTLHIRYIVQYVGMGFESGEMEEGGGCIYPSGKDGGISGREEDMLKTSLVD